MGTMKMWIGNLDGNRLGLVISSSKERARKIVRASRSEFDGYWALQKRVDHGLEFEVLYTKPIDGRGTWTQGRCAVGRQPTTRSPLPRRGALVTTP